MDLSASKIITELPQNIYKKGNNDVNEVGLELGFSKPEKRSNIHRFVLSDTNNLEKTIG